MANPFTELFFGNGASGGLVEVITPWRTFDDVILPEKTRRALDNALVQIEKHDLLYHRWGLAERHSSGLGLAFNFAGPPGTGKTICAEAVAHALDRKLLLARYAELESMWVGSTGKNVEAVFQQAERQNAVLFFDEADAIATRRFTGVDQGYQREANAVVNVMLRELEEFNGVVIFATNLAANLDPAFERRIRTHVLFTRPNAQERKAIWKVQIHEHKTPLADDVDFEALAEAHKATGGDIKNAVLKAAQMAVAEPGRDEEKRIHHRHFEQGIREVLEAKEVMSQSLFQEGRSEGTVMGALQQVASRQQASEDKQKELKTQLMAAEEQIKQLAKRFEKQQNIHLHEQTEQRWQWLAIGAALLLALASGGLAFLL